MKTMPEFTIDGVPVCPGDVWYPTRAEAAALLFGGHVAPEHLPGRYRDDPDSEPSGVYMACHRS